MIWCDWQRGGWLDINHTICAQKYFPQFYPTPFQYIILKYHYKSPNWAPKRRCSDVTDKGEVDSILTTKHTAQYIVIIFRSGWKLQGWKYSVFSITKLQSIFTKAGTHRYTRTQKRRGDKCLSMSQQQSTFLNYQCTPADILTYPHSRKIYFYKTK